MTKSRNLIRAQWKPSAEQLAELARDYSTTSTAELAARFGVQAHQVYKAAYSRGLKKTAEYLASAGGQTDGTKGMGTRFQKGVVPWSKGRKMTGKVAATCFKPGARPHNYAEIGSHRVAGGVVYRKQTATGYPPRDWVAVHRIVWMAAHGPIPPGYVVAFKDGRRSTDPDAITLDGLELVSQSEIISRNRLPPELQAVAQLRAVVTRTINRMTKEST